MTILPVTSNTLHAMRKLLPIFILLLFSSNTFTASLQPASQMAELVLKVKIIGVKDGDTVEGLYYQLPINIRLEHIDAPEKKQAFGTVSKKKLSELALGKIVTIVSKGKKGNHDSRGRLIAELFTDEKTCLNKEMLKAGLAWHYKKYSTDANYAQLENTARKNKTGLWKDPNPIAPWDFRK